MKLNISKDFSLPIDAVTQTFSILAKRRVGKTYTASVMAEEMVKAKLPFVVLDPTGAWWGLRSGKDGRSEGGLPVYVIGGEHGIPLEPTAGKVIAEQVATYPSFYVIDISQFESNAAQDRFATDFAERLYRIKEKNREVMHLFIDEADAFAPQRPMPGQQRMLGAFEVLVRRGGIRGIGITLITQRPAVINKNVLTQTECLIVLQTTSPQDQDAIEEWVKRNGSDEERKTLMSSLASLKRSEAWIYSPAWLEVFKRINIRERDTFNSSATPKAGEKQINNPSLKQVDIEKLSQQIKATIEKTKENDPEILKRKIRELERNQSIKNVVSPDMLLVNNLKETIKGQDKEIIQLRKQLLQTNETIKLTFQKTLKTVKSYVDKIDFSEIDIPIIVVNTQNEFFKMATTPNTDNSVIGKIIIKEKFNQSPCKTTIRDGEIKLKDGAKRMLAAAVKWNPLGITGSQMKTQAGIKHVNTFSTYKTQLISVGLLFLNSGSGLFYPTEEGIKYSGDTPSAETTEEVLALWLPHFKDGARRMLRFLVTLDGKAITHESLMQEARIEHPNTYSTYKTQLKSAHLVVENDGMISANKETLFL